MSGQSRGANGGSAPGGRRVTLAIDSIAHGGEGVGRESGPKSGPESSTESGQKAGQSSGHTLDAEPGRVVFVPGTLPGEIVDVRLTEERARFARGELGAVRVASPDRRPPTCPAAAAGAGCCDLSMTTSQRSREIKADVLREQLLRVGKLRGAEFAALLEGIEVRDPGEIAGATPAIHASALVPPAEKAAMRGWRTVARWHVGAGGRIGVRRAGAHDVVAERCAQVGSGIIAAVDELEGLGFPEGAEVALAEGANGVVAVQWRPADPAGGGGVRRGRGRHTGDRRAGRGGRGIAQARRARAARSAEWLAIDALPGDAGGAADALVVPATPAVARRELVHELLPSWSWDVAAGDFWQPHRAAPAAYAAHTRSAIAAVLDGRSRVRAKDGVGEAAGTVGRELRVWDLYGGVGTLGSAALDAVASADGRALVTTVEASPSAVMAGERTARRQRAELEMVRADVARWLESGGAVLPDLVITDPPRAGLGADVVRGIAAAAPARVLHIGCDIAAFARDVGDFVAAGFRIESIEGIDAFPGTHHAEAVAHLVGPGRD